jgi:hypothetical protein
MLSLKTPTSVDRARVDAILEAGCRHGCTGEAMLVKARVQGGGYQVRIQCLTCGDHLGSALSQASHGDWRDYPETDPAIAARFRAPVNMGPTLALEASRLLEMDLFCGHAEMGLDILLLPSGFAALLKRHLAFMDATARAILTAVQKHQSPEETVTL